MKKVLGKLLILIFLFTALSASDYSWQQNISSANIYQHESIELEFKCHFDTKEALTSIEFQLPKKSEAYSIEILSEKEMIVDEKRVNVYRFVLFANKTGDFTIPFQALMRKTTKESIENTVLGRDNAEDFDFKDTLVKLEPIQLYVAKTPSALSGALSLDALFNKTQAYAYKPVNLTLTLKGAGNLKGFSFQTLEIDGAKIFTEDAKEDLQLTSKGYQGSITKEFAIVSDKDFTIPSFEIAYYDVISQSHKHLKTSAQEIKINNPYTKEELLDEAKEDTQESTFPYIDILNFVLTFAFGFISALYFVKYKKSKEITEYNSWCKRIKKAKTHEELLFLLALSDDKKYQGLIYKLEQGTNINLSEIKKEIRCQ